MPPLDLTGMEGGEIVFRVLHERPPFERGYHLEPSLLPHIARLCHEASIGELLVAGDVFGKHGYFPWPQLRTWVRYQLLARFTDDQLLRAGGWSLTAAELRVRRAILDQRPVDDDVWSEIDQVDDTEIRRELTALACALDPAGKRRRLRELTAVFDPSIDDIETVRIMMTIQTRIVGQPSVGDLAPAWTGYAGIDPFRAAHLLYLVPETDRPELLAAIHAQVSAIGVPAWVVALFASRAASMAPGATVWNVDEYDDPHGVWAAFLDELAGAGRTTPEGDTYRAHPFASILERLAGPHEPTVGAADQMVDEFGGAGPPETASAEPDGAAAPAGPSGGEVDDDLRDAEAAEIIDDDTGEVDFVDETAVVYIERGSTTDSTSDTTDDGDLVAAEPDKSAAPDDESDGGGGGDEPSGEGRTGVRPSSPASRPATRASPLPYGSPAPATAGPSRSHSAASEPASGSGAEVDNRRLGVDAFARGRELARALVRDVPHTFEVSIGHGARFRVRTPTMVPFAPDVEMRRLPVRFVGDGFDQTEFMTLRRNPSHEGKVSFELTPTGESFSAMLVVYNEDRSLVIQAGHLTADVVASAAELTAEPSIGFEVLPAAPLGVERPGAATVVTAGDQLAVTTKEIAVAAAVTGVLGEVDRLLQALQSAAGDVALSGADSPSFERALRGAARAGARLHSKLQLGDLDAVDRIQVVSVTGETVLPLELVYDGPAPDDDAPLCKNWKKSLRRGRCPSCDRRTGDDRAKVVCPMRFWACRKVIEHHQGATVGQTEFAVRVLTDASSVSIRRPEAAIVGASKQVDEALSAGAGPNTLDELLKESGKLGKAARVADWRGWTSAVASSGATLLIAMPHQETISDSGVNSPALELGGMFETTFDERFWRRAGEMPGPVLFLLGCNTAIEARAITSFASWFRQWSPVVIATIGEVIADEAPAVATTILVRFDSAWRRRRTSTVGEALRDTRAALLADGRLVGLQLVLHGEAAWQVGRKA